MVRWHHKLNGYEFEQAPGDSGRQMRLACCSPLGLQRDRQDLATKQQMVKLF